MAMYRGQWIIAILNQLLRIRVPAVLGGRDRSRHDRGRMPPSLVQRGAVVENLQVVFVLQLAAEIRASSGVCIACFAGAGASAVTPACAGAGHITTATAIAAVFTRSTVGLLSRTRTRRA